MAQPDTENGFTKIANELLDALYRVRLSGNEYAIVLYVVRMAYGWRNKFTKQAIRVVDFSRELGMSKSSVHLALTVLLEKMILLRDDLGRWAIQKDWEKWLDSKFSPLNKVQPTEQKKMSKVQPTEQKVQPTEPPYLSSKEMKEKGSPPPKSAGSRSRSKSGASKTTAGSAGSPPKPYELKTPRDRVMAAYKLCLGRPWDDRAWDRDNYSTWARAADKLLRAFKEDVNAAIDYMRDFKDRMEKIGRPAGESWNLATIARTAWDRGGEHGATEAAVQKPAVLRDPESLDQDQAPEPGSAGPASPSRGGGLQKATGLAARWIEKAHGP